MPIGVKILSRKGVIFIASLLVIIGFAQDNRYSVNFSPPSWGFGSSFLSAAGLGSGSLEPPGAGVPPGFPPSGILYKYIKFGSC